MRLPFGFRISRVYQRQSGAGGAWRLLEWRCCLVLRPLVRSAPLCVVTPGAANSEDCYVAIVPVRAAIAIATKTGGLYACRGQRLDAPQRALRGFQTI